MIAHSLPRCINESRFSDPLPTEKTCSENVLTSYSLSNFFESASTQNFLMKFFA
jgi:hypothetical protein